MNVNELKPNQMVYGNKGNVWTNTAHIFESGKGNLCGTPSLATNWARIEGVEVAGCPECLAKANANQFFGVARFCSEFCNINNKNKINSYVKRNR